MKILFIPRWFPSRLDSLNGIFIKRHALSVSLKHRVAVLYLNADPSLKTNTYATEFSMEEGIFVVRVYYNNSFLKAPGISSTLVKFFRYLRACKMGVKVIKKEFGLPDVVHVHVLARTFLPAYYYNFFYKIPFVVSEQWSGYLPEDGMYKGFLKKRFTKVAVQRASAVTAVSESLKKGMISHGLVNSYSVIPNVVDIKLFYPFLKDTKKDKFILLHISNLVDRAKNVSGMIQAVKKVAVGRKDFEFHIVGDGEERNKLEALAGELDLLGKQVFFLGTKTSSEVAAMMRNADLFLLFSNYDNMPCVMVESFASGLPVIGSAIHGIKEHVKEGRGIAVTPGDENAFSEAIIHAMGNMHAFDKMKLNIYAKENFSYEAVSNQFDSIYQKVILK